MNDIKDGEFVTARQARIMLRLDNFSRQYFNQLCQRHGVKSVKKHEDSRQARYSLADIRMLAEKRGIELTENIPKKLDTERVIYVAVPVSGDFTVPENVSLVEAKNETPVATA